MSTKYIQSPRETLTLLIWRGAPNSNPATWLVVEEMDPRLLKRGLDAHQSRKLEPPTMAPILAVLAADDCAVAHPGRCRSRL